MGSGARVIAVPVVVAVVSALALLVARSAALRVFRAWADKAEGRLRTYKAVRAAMSTPSVYWCIAAGLYLGMAVSDLPEKYVFYFTRTIHVVLVLSVTVGVANTIGGVFTAQAGRLGIPMSRTALAGGVIKGTVVVIGVLVILAILGVSIAPLLTALGVGGLAVALALQDTLGDLFAGFHLLMEKSIRVGDFIRLESGHEGYVDDITWRAARVRTLAGNMVMIPNKKLAQSVVVNYSLPVQEMGVSVAVRVPYGTDYDRVKAIIIEEADKSADLPGLVEGQTPSVSFDQAESWVECSLNLSVKRFVDQYGVKSELKKRILERLAAEGVEMPFPAKTVYVKEAQNGRTGTSL